ncbi:GNAT family N-acetyltransferase [Rothia nasisuis]|uniref:GNAT family N-acetyltransferase n=1 Tax=Rothia nasisuis TaxID=2109647 RepID=UPI001F1889A1|nr:GNAT family N-acetyltransferase [Rothia nasisuis]
MTVIIRPATLTDAAALSDFAGTYFPDAAPATVPRAAVAEFIATNLDEASLARHIATGAYAFTIALNTQGEIIAYTGIDHEAEQPAEVPGSAAYLSKFYLSEEARGTGLAQELMSRVIEDARADGKDGLHLGTHRENVRAQKFYEKMGFKRVGERVFRLTETVVGHDYIFYLPL